MIRFLHKHLGVLVLFQSVLVLLLFMKVSTLENRSDLPEHSAVPVQQEVMQASQSSQAGPVVVQQGLDSREIRRILREELSGIARSDELPVGETSYSPEPPVYDEVEMQYRRELVAEEFDRLKLKREVSTGELNSLLDDIARLNPETRTEMMRKLNVALNSGKIKGRF